MCSRSRLTAAKSDAKAERIESERVSERRSVTPAEKTKSEFVPVQLVPVVLTTERNEAPLAPPGHRLKEAPHKNKAASKE